MTVEVTVMNKYGVAMAADSLVAPVDVEGRIGKAFLCEDKIHSLPPQHKVGFMSYGNNDFMGIPWSTAIYEFGERLRALGPLPSLDEYVTEFIKFLAEDELLSKHYDAQSCYVRIAIKYVDLVERRLRSELEQVAQKLEAGEEDPTTDAFENPLELKEWLTTKLLDADREAIESGNPVRNLPDTFEKNFRAEMNRSVKPFLDKVTEKWHASKKTGNDLYRNIVGLAKTFVVEENHPLRDLTGTEAGIVIAGFGHADLFPGTCNILIDGVICKGLRYVVQSTKKIGLDLPADVCPYATTNPVNAFLYGIYPPYLELGSGLMKLSYEQPIKVLRNTIMQVIEARLAMNTAGPSVPLDELKEELYGMFDLVMGDWGTESANFGNTFRAFGEEHFRDPILETVEGLPKAELASFAEFLIDHVRISYKFSPKPQTVGGPIDVALVSRDEGFVWIKRKSYSQSEGLSIRATKVKDSLYD